MKYELQRVHIKYISRQKQEKMNKDQINKKMHFLKQLINLGNKGNMITAKYTADKMISDNYPCINIEDYNIMKEYQIYCSKRVEAKLMKT